METTQRTTSSSRRRRRSPAGGEPSGAGCGPRDSAPGSPSRRWPASATRRPTSAPSRPGVAKPSMAALNYLSERLGMPASAFVVDTDDGLDRLEADLRLAQGDFAGGRSRGTATCSRPDRTRAERAPLLAGHGRGALSGSIAATRRSGPRRRRSRSSRTSVVRPNGSTPCTGWPTGHHAADNHGRGPRPLRRGSSTRCGSTGRRSTRSSASGPSSRSAWSRWAPAGTMPRSPTCARRTASPASSTPGAGPRSCYAIATGYRRAGDHEAAIRAGTQSLALFRSRRGEPRVGRDRQPPGAGLSRGRQPRPGAARRPASAGPSRGQAGDDRLLAHIADTAGADRARRRRTGRGRRLADEAIELARRKHQTSPALLDAMVTKARTCSSSERGTEAASELLRRGGRPRPTPGTGIAAAQGRPEQPGPTRSRSAGDHARAYEIMREARQPAR